MTILKNAKIPLLIIGILIIGFLIYNTIFKKPPVETGIEKISQEQSAQKKLTKDFTVLLALIKSVDFDEKFFQDPVFKSLVDFSKPVKEEDKTRSNPFAPGIASSFTDVSLNSLVGSSPVTASTTPTTSTTSTTTRSN